MKVSEIASDGARKAGLAMMDKAKNMMQRRRGGVVVSSFWASLLTIPCLQNNVHQRMRRPRLPRELRSSD